MLDDPYTHHLSSEEDETVGAEGTPGRHVVFVDHLATVKWDEAVVNDYHQNGTIPNSTATVVENRSIRLEARLSAKSDILKKRLKWRVKFNDAPVEWNPSFVDGNGEQLDYPILIGVDRSTSGTYDISAVLLNKAMEDGQSFTDADVYRRRDAKVHVIWADFKDDENGKCFINTYSGVPARDEFDDIYVTNENKYYIDNRRLILGAYSSEPIVHNGHVEYSNGAIIRQRIYPFDKIDALLKYNVSFECIRNYKYTAWIGIDISNDIVIYNRNNKELVWIPLKYGDGAEISHWNYSDFTPSCKGYIYDYDSPGLKVPYKYGMIWFLGFRNIISHDMEQHAVINIGNHKYKISENINWSSNILLERNNLNNEIIRIINDIDFVRDPNFILPVKHPNRNLIDGWFPF